MANKTPAMILNELCSKSSAVLHYECERITPLTSAPIFTCKCTVNNFGGKDFTAIHTGGTKKTAQQNVSELMLRSHLKIPMSEPETVNALLLTPKASLPSTSQAISSGNVVSDPPEIQANAAVGNCIGDLTAFCETKQISYPEYNEEGSDGPPHCPLFMVSCTVGTIKEIGTSPKKQISKRIAAYKVLGALKRIEEFGKLETVEKKIIGPEEAAKIYDIVNTNQENRKKENGRARPKPGFAHDVNMCREEFLDVRQKYDKFELGPLVLQLLSATENIGGKGCSPVKMRIFIKEWAATRDPDAGGIISFFDGLRQEMPFSFVKIVRDTNADKNRFRVKQRQGRKPHDLINFKDMAAETENSNGKAWMVHLELTNKNPENTESFKSKYDSDRMPSAVGFGASEDEAFLNAVVDILVSFSIMLRPTAI